ncbi:FecR/PupR family sigma factor regulator, partial [Pseudomonas aeruginosa]
MALARAVLEGAAPWYVRFGAEPPNDGERQAWREWLEADPRHRRAWRSPSFGGSAPKRTYQVAAASSTSISSSMVSPCRATGSGSWREP